MCGSIILSEASATDPNGATYLGPIISNVSLRFIEQLRISVMVGESFLPSTALGLHSTALVMKIAALLIPALEISHSKFRPVWSPNRGIPNLSAPSLPGASAMKTTEESKLPLGGPSTRVRSVMRGQRLQR